MSFPRRRESRNVLLKNWMPAYASMTGKIPRLSNQLIRKVFTEEKRFLANVVDGRIFITSGAVLGRMGMPKTSGHTKFCRTSPFTNFCSSYWGFYWEGMFWLQTIQQFQERYVCVAWPTLRLKWFE
jgi:hypothetical protein